MFYNSTLTEVTDLKNFLFTILAICALAFASFAVPTAESPPQADTATVISFDEATAPSVDVATADPAAAVHTVAEVDIGNSAIAVVRKEQTTARSFSPWNVAIEYAAKPPDASLSRRAQANHTHSLGFSGLGANHYARADV
jgi:hypothetical protein